MNRNTAAGLRSACTRVLEVAGDGWEKMDVTTIDIEDLLVRFQNLKKKDFRPQVLEVYKQRFRKAVVSYLDYLRSPSGWKPSSQERSAASQRNERSPKRPVATETVSVGAATGRVSPGEVEYPFPLRPGVMARLILPSNLTQQDVSRLTAFMAMLVVGAGEPRPEVENSDGQ
ncbi:MAG: hypothetical protein WAN65_04085 [Candidatus Sulfotelmatobacter sp.]